MIYRFIGARKCILTMNSRLLMLIFGVLVAWGTYVFFVTKPELAIDAKKQKVTTSQELASKSVFIKGYTVDSVPAKKTQQPSKHINKKTPKLKPSHLYVKSDAQLKHEFKQREIQRKRFSRKTRTTEKRHEK